MLLPVSIVAAGGAEQHREADRDHKPTGICTKPSSIGFGKSAFSLDDSRTWQVRVAVPWWLPEAVTGCVTCAKWPLIMKPLSSALWVDSHQRVKLLMQKTPVLAVLEKNSRSSQAWSLIQWFVHAG